MESRPQTMMLALLLLLALAQQSQAQRGPSGFPWCRCDATSFDTPFIISNVTLSETDATRDYTFTFGTSGCLITSPCCAMDLNKLAFHAKEGCSAAMVKRVVVTTIQEDYSVTTQERSVQFRDYGPGKLMYKVTNLKWVFNQVQGSNITVSLVKGTPCDTLSTFLDETNFAVLDKGTKCCPTMKLPPLPA